MEDVFGRRATEDEEKRNRLRRQTPAPLSDALPKVALFKGDKFRRNVSTAALCITPAARRWNMSAVSPKAAELTACLI